MQLQAGRPANCERRLEKERRTYDFLDKCGIPYLRADHEEAMTMEACQQVNEAFGGVVCKNILLCNRQKTSFYLLLLEGSIPFRTSVLSRQIGSARLSFADGCFMEEFLNITPGSLSVLGLMNDTDHRVQLLIDRSVLSKEYIGAHPCINTSTVRFLVSDLLNVFLPAVHHDYISVDLNTGSEENNDTD